jgi:hypothetical protein
VSQNNTTGVPQNAGSADQGLTDVASDGVLDARTAQASPYMGGSPEMSVVDR